MLSVEHISLASGQSYEDVEILQTNDFDVYGVPRSFGDYTLAFLAQGNCYLVNQWNVRIIRLNKSWKAGKHGTKFQKLVIDRDIVFNSGYLLNKSEYSDLEIPNIIGPELTQIAWSCDDGIMISHDANVVSLVLKDPRGGTDKVIIRSSSPKSSSLKPKRKRSQAIGKILRS